MNCSGQGGFGLLSDEKLLGGRYRLGSGLGRGGMGDVRLGLDVKLGRAVAIKLLAPELAGDPAARERFQREARSAARLNHPAIVAVYDTGETEDPVTGVVTPYIVMELVEGQTLGTLLRRGEPLPAIRALQLTEGVLDALAHSHEAGIVHQDIKPGNVMLNRSGDVKVMDFGIARSISDQPDGSTPSSMVYGSARYLSPEQARGETTDVRSDIYSSGCLLYELLAGRPPFVGDSPLTITVQHLHDLPVPPSQRNPAVPLDVDAVVLRALAKSPQERYQSAQQMRAEVAAVREHITEVPTLASAVSSAQMLAFVSRVAGPPLRGVRSRTRPRRAVGPTSSGHRRRAALAAAALTAVALPLGGFGLYSVNQPDAVAGGSRVSEVLQAPKAQAEVLPAAGGAAASSARRPAASGDTAATPTRVGTAASLATAAGARAVGAVGAGQAAAVGVADASSTLAADPTTAQLQTQGGAAGTPSQSPPASLAAASTAPTRQTVTPSAPAAPPSSVPAQPTSPPSASAPSPSRTPKGTNSPRPAAPTPTPSSSPTPSSPSPQPVQPSQPSSPTSSAPVTPKPPQSASPGGPAQHHPHGQGHQPRQAPGANSQPGHRPNDPGLSPAPAVHEHPKPVHQAKPGHGPKHDKVHQPSQPSTSPSQAEAARRAAAAAAKAGRGHGHHGPAAGQPPKHQGGDASTSPHDGGHGKGGHK